MEHGSFDQPAEGEVFEVESIIDFEIGEMGKKYFCVRWKGYGSEDDTWEPDSNLLTCGNLVKEFMKSHKRKKKKRRRKEEKEQAKHMRPESQTFTDGQTGRTSAGQMPSSSSQSAEQVLDSNVSLDEVLGDSLGLTRQSRKELERILAESRLASVCQVDSTADGNKPTDPALLSCSRLEPGEDAAALGSGSIKPAVKEQPFSAHIKQESDEDSQDSSEHAQPVRGKVASRKRLLIADSSSDSEPDEETKELLIKWGERRFSSEDFVLSSRKQISMGRRSKPALGDGFGGRPRGLSDSNVEKEDVITARVLDSESKVVEQDPLNTGEEDVVKIDEPTSLKACVVPPSPQVKVSASSQPLANSTGTDSPTALHVKPALTPTKFKERSSTPTVEDIRKNMDTGGLMQTLSTLKQNLNLGGKARSKDEGQVANENATSRPPSENHGLSSARKGVYVAQQTFDARSDLGKTGPVEKENQAGPVASAISASNTGVPLPNAEPAVVEDLEKISKKEENKDNEHRSTDTTELSPADNVNMTPQKSMISPSVQDALRRGPPGPGARNEWSPSSIPLGKAVTSDRSMMKGNLVLFPLGRIPARSLSTSKEDILRRLSEHDSSKESLKPANPTPRTTLCGKTAAGSHLLTHGMQPSDGDRASESGVSHMQSYREQGAAVQVEGREIPCNSAGTKVAETAPMQTDLVTSVTTGAVLGGRVAAHVSSVTSGISKTTESIITTLDKVAVNRLPPEILHQGRTSSPSSPSSGKSVPAQSPFGKEASRFPAYETDAISSRAASFHSQRSLDSSITTNLQQDRRSGDALRKRPALGRTLPNRQLSWSTGDPPEPKTLLPQPDSPGIPFSHSALSRERGAAVATNVSVPSSFVNNARHGQGIKALLGSPKPKDAPDRRPSSSPGLKSVATELSGKDTATSLTSTVPLGDAGIHLEFTKFPTTPTEAEPTKLDLGVPGLPPAKLRQLKGMRTVKKLSVVNFEPPKQDILGELLGPHDERGNADKGSSEKSEEASRQMTEREDSPAFHVSESESEGDLELELECLDLEEEGLVGRQQRIYHDFNDKLRVVQPIKLTDGELKAAVIKNRLDRVLGALAAHNDPDFVDRETDKSLLMLAIAHGNKDIARALLWGGADPNYQTRDGTTALMLAVEKGDRALISSLVLNGAYIETQKPNGESALTIACNQGFPDVVVLLLNHGADAKLLSAAPATPVSVQQHLVHAIIEKHNERLRELMEHFLSQFISEFASVVKPAVLPCRCLSPRDNREQELYFEFNRNPCDPGISIVFLCLPAEFHQDGSIRIKVAEVDSGVKSVSLNGKKQCQVIPGEWSLHILFPNFGQVNHLCFRTVEPKYKLLVAVYAIQLKNELMRSMGLMGRY